MISARDRSGAYGRYRGVMRKLLLVVLLLVFGVTEADARRRGHRHRHHGMRHFHYVMPPDANVTAQPRGGYRQRAPAPSVDAPPVSPFAAAPPSESPAADPRPERAEVAPPDWQLQAPDPRWNGRRFVSPDGKAWLAFYAGPGDQEPVTAHMKTVAFVDGEEITSLRAERDWIAVAGVKADRIFYRKAVLACGGNRWHHVAFEYPAESRAAMEPIVSRTARALDTSKNYGCDTTGSAAR
jgi:hypothetical protein